LGGEQSVVLSWRISFLELNIPWLETDGSAFHILILLGRGYWHSRYRSAFCDRVVSRLGIYKRRSKDEAIYDTFYSMRFQHAANVMKSMVKS
jgi:hypothetical protein